MIFRNKLLLFVLSLCFSGVISAQEAAALDSLKKAYASATTPESKVNLLDEVSRVMMNVNPKEADEYGKKLIAEAEVSRDRKLMFTAYLSNGIRCTYLANQKAYSQRAIEYYNKALELAQENRMDKEASTAQMYLAGVHLMLPDNEKALSYAIEANALASSLSNDSLLAESYNTYGQVYRALNKKILALRNFLNALRIAEDIKNNSLLRNCYLNLSTFYSSIEDYDRAIDYMTRAYNKLDVLTESNVPYMRVIYLNNIGNLFAGKKSYDIAISHFERSIRMADSLKFSTLKLPGYVSLLNQYLRIDEPQKALEYMNSADGDNLKKYLTNFGMAPVIDQAYGIIYTELGRFDSARIFLQRARPMFENSTNGNSKVGFYQQMADFYRKSGDKKKAIEYYLQVKEMSEKNGLLENVKAAAKRLDSLYTETGNVALAGEYKAVYYQYKDSIEALNKEKKLAQMEVDEEQIRQDKRVKEAAKEAAELKRRKNNIQYIGIVIGIITLFIGLVVLGMFKVSAGVIKAIGFFVFIMFFEFIFLIFKKNIYSITEGEPWKDLAFMIALAALLVPLHHWMEHKVLHYLTSHNRLTAAGSHIKNKLLRRTKRTEQ